MLLQPKNVKALEDCNNINFSSVAELQKDL